jgi:hypothetical protein
MKKIYFVVSFVAIALCMAMNLIASPDVGNNASGLQMPHPPSLQCAHFEEFHPMKAVQSATLTQVKNFACLLESANECGVLREKAKQHVFWEGGSTKASLCKAEAGVDIYSKILICSRITHRHWRPCSKA